MPSPFLVTQAAPNPQAALPSAPVGIDQPQPFWTPVARGISDAADAVRQGAADEARRGFAADADRAGYALYKGAFGATAGAIRGLGEAADAVGHIEGDPSNGAGALLSPVAKPFEQAASRATAGVQNPTVFEQGAALAGGIAPAAAVGAATGGVALPIVFGLQGADQVAQSNGDNPHDAVGVLGNALAQGALSTLPVGKLLEGFVPQLGSRLVTSGARLGAGTVGQAGVGAAMGAAENLATSHPADSNLFSSAAQMAILHVATSGPGALREALQPTGAGEEPSPPSQAAPAPSPGGPTPPAGPALPSNIIDAEFEDRPAPGQQLALPAPKLERPTLANAPDDVRGAAQSLDRAGLDMQAVGTQRAGADYDAGVSALQTGAQAPQIEPTQDVSTLFTDADPHAGEAPASPPVLSTAPAQAALPGADGFVDEAHRDLYRLGVAARAASGDFGPLLPEAQRLSAAMSRLMDWSDVGRIEGGADLSPRERAGLRSGEPISGRRMIDAARDFANDVDENGYRAESYYDPDRLGEVLAARSSAAPLQSSQVTGVTSYRGRPIYGASFDPRTLNAAPDVFQYKAGGDDAGVTSRLQGVQTWDPTSAGKVIAWEDPTGTYYVADGHQRLGLAMRLLDQGPKLDATLFRASDGWSAQDVRTIAALKSIREGSGTPLDAAKVLRANDGSASDDSLPVSGDFITQAKGLARLSDDAFGATVNGVVPQRYAAQIGVMAGDRTELHASMVNLLAKAKPANMDEARALVSESLEQDFLSRESVQADMFGGAPAESTVIARAKVKAAVLRQVRGDGRLFSTLTRQADAIEAGGNALARDANEAALATNRAAEALISKLAYRDGPIADAMKEAAERVTAGEPPAEAAREVANQVRRAIKGASSIEADREVRLEPAKPMGDPLKQTAAFDLPGGKGQADQFTPKPEDAEVEKEGMQAPRTPISTLTGEEIAPLDADTKALRAAAKRYYADVLQPQSVESRALGRPVGFVASGRDKAVSFSADPDKLRLFAALPELIRDGELTKSDINYRSGRSDAGTRAYHTLEGDVRLGDKTVRMRVLVRETASGDFHYDHAAENAEASADSERGTDPASKSGSDAQEPTEGPTNNMHPEGERINMEAEPQPEPRIPPGLLDDIREPNPARVAHEALKGCATGVDDGHLPLLHQRRRRLRPDRQGHRRQGARRLWRGLRGGLRDDGAGRRGPGCRQAGAGRSRQASAGGGAPPATPGAPSP